MRPFSILMLIVLVASACNAPATQVTPTHAPTNTPLAATPTSVPPPTAPAESAARVTPAGTVTVACKNAPSDSWSINLAILGSAVGDEIVISGQCMITTTIKLLDERTYRGTSRSGTVLRQADGANLDALLASESYLDNHAWTGMPITIRDMKLDGNSAGNPGSQTSGIILRSWLSYVEDLWITGMTSDGIRLTENTANGTPLANNEVNGRISANFIDQCGQYGIHVVDQHNRITDWTLTDNWIGMIGVDGVHLDNAAGWMIARNHIYLVPENGLYAHRLWGTTISDNYIENFGESQKPGVWSGIYATVQGGAASTVSGNRIFNPDFLENGNQRPGSTYRYLALSVNYDIGEVSVIGNTIRGTKSPNEIGLYYSGGGTHRLVVTSFGNIVDDVHVERVTDGSVILSDGY